MTKEFDARNENKSRSVCAAMAEAADTGKRVLSEKERRILDMWPRFEDGEPVMIGDEVDGLGGEIIEVYITENEVAIWNNSANHMHLSPGERVKRPAPEVLDADGMPIKVDDTVWHEDGSELHVIGFGGAQDGETMLVVEYVAGPTKWGEVRCLSVTHTRPAPKVLDADGVEIHVGDTVRSSMYGDNDFTVSRFVKNCKGETFVMVEEMWSGLPPLTVTHARPDSWERLEEDAVKVVCEYAGAVPDEFGDYDCDTCRLFDARGKLICEQQMALDIVRRAKAIAGVEVDG